MVSYASQWKEYRTRNFQASVGLLGLPLVVAFAAFLGWLTHSSAISLLVSFATGWAVFWGWLAFRAVRFPCPRCGIPFLANQDPWARCCEKCGLKLYEGEL